MNIAVLGYGKQGASAAQYWAKDPGNSITICDENENTPAADNFSKKLGEDYLSDLDQFDLIIRSPIIHPDQIATANTPDILSKVTTNTNEFFKVCPSKNILAVTGTKGKGTTSTLIAKMLEAAGKSVHLGGNIGTPPLEMLSSNIQPDDWVVLELANFQLIDLKYSPHIAVCLMVADEHLDWHKDSQEYITAKQQLFRYQSPEDIAVFYGLNPTSQHIASISKGHKVPYMEYPGADVIENKVLIDGQVICEAAEIKLLGRHNWQNVCAAVTAVWQAVQDKEAIKQVITSFSGIEHRLELAGEHEGVKYYDDSFGTTPETAIVAIEAFSEPKIVILGGSDKGSDYDGLARTIAGSNVKKVLLIGEMADKIKLSLDKAGFSEYTNGGDSIGKIIETAKSIAKPGDVVLLSPACASFDMFKNYADRGNQFKRAVQALG
jgi:UDP-N-acetylmuramoylalanine--D-glutamate ligase